MRACPVRLSLCHRWICVSENLQNFWWGEMEEQRHFYCILLPRLDLQHLLHLELGVVGEGIFRCDSLQYTSCTSRSLVRSLCPTYLPRSLSWIQEKGNRGTSSHEPDSSTDSHAEYLHETAPLHHHGWGATLRMHIHPAVLHSEQHLVTSNLLHVWLLVSCVCHPCHHMFRNSRALVLLPPVLRGLSLVVAFILDVGFDRAVSVRVQRSLFRDEDVHHRSHQYLPLLWLHEHHVHPLFAANRYCRIFCMFLLHSQNLWGCQGGLISVCDLHV